LMVSYSNERKNVSRYECRRKHDACGAPACIGFSAIDVDARVGDELLAVVRPAAVEVSLRAIAEDGATQDQAVEALEAELEAAQYAVTRAWRQYDAADPENRLVVDDLERRWNEALERTHNIERRIADRRAARPATAPSFDLFASLAADLERVWSAPTTDAVLKKRIARALIEEIVVDIENDREIAVLIHWKGGVHTELRVAKRRRGENRASTGADAVDAIRALALFFDDERIASFLGRAGLKTAKGLAWSRPIVAAIRHARAIPPRSASSAEPWLTLQQAVELVRAAPETLQGAVVNGDIEALHPLANGPWLFRRESLQRWSLSRRARRDRAAPTAAQLDLAISRR
jgi:hypothetical protein